MKFEPPFANPRSVGTFYGQEAFCDGDRFTGPVLFVPSCSTLFHAKHIDDLWVEFEVVEGNQSTYSEDPRRAYRSYITQDEHDETVFTGVASWQCQVELTWAGWCSWPLEQYGSVMAALKPWLRTLLPVDAPGNEYWASCWE